MLKKLFARLSSPLPLREGLGALLLLVGSTSLWAQDDPFGDVNIHKYQGNMTITAQVKQNGNVVTDAVVAVYCRGELRGKKCVGAGTNPNLAYLTVYGEYTGNNDYLYFKVYTGGVTFTCNPDPAITFTFNGEIGGELEPYIIFLPVSLADDADNTSVLTDFAEQTCDVVLIGRTLIKDGNWNTLCLPFGISDFAGTPLEGATVKTLTSSDFNGGTLTMTFGDDLTSIEAGVPYIVKWTSDTDIEDPVFTGVTISNATANAETDYVDFVGTYSPVVYDTAHKDVLFLGGNNKLYYPDGTAATTIKACRAYFRLKNGLTAGDPVNGVKAFELNFDGEDSADSLNEELRVKSEESNDAWYTLGGRKLRSKPTLRGLYINNGKKVLK